MATLKELCASVPKEVLRVQTCYNLNQRKVASYKERMESLSNERDVFGVCKQARPKKKWHNRASTIEAGTMGSMTITKRFSNSRLTCVCKTRNW